MKEYFDSSKIVGNNIYYIKRAPKYFGRFVHHIKLTLSVYRRLEIRNIYFDTDAVTISLEIDNEIRNIIISNYIVREISSRLENDRYYSDSIIELFDSNLKLKTLEAFYGTQISNQDS